MLKTSARPSASRRRSAISAIAWWPRSPHAYAARGAAHEALAASRTIPATLRFISAPLFMVLHALGAPAACYAPDPPHTSAPRSPHDEPPPDAVHPRQLAPR